MRLRCTFSAAAKNPATSRTDRASTELLVMWTGRILSPESIRSRPRVGFNPTNPQACAGIRIDPPPSLPCEIGTTPAATYAAEPPELPPEE